jgi:copper chaperone CopZ
MTQRYKITGMTCSSCVARVQQALESIPGVKHAEVTLNPPVADVDSLLSISTQTFRNALAAAGNYDASVLSEEPVPASITAEEIPGTSFKPLIVIGLYIILISTLASYRDFSMHLWMRIFMASFFLVFSFFKMLDLKSFAGSYKMYDLPAKYIPGYAYVYPFIELLLGVLYALDVTPPVYTNVATLVVMGISIIGVIQSVMNKKKIRCACLGSVFNLPMTTVTIVEDGLMIVMALAMLMGG